MLQKRLTPKKDDTGAEHLLAFLQSVHTKVCSIGQKGKQTGRLEAQAETRHKHLTGLAEAGEGLGLKDVLCII